MASELKKPDMVHTLFPEEIPSKMWALPIGELFMVGRATERKLLSRNIKTIGDLAHCDPEWVRLYLKSHGTLIWNYANGNDCSLVRTNRRPVIKGVGNSTTIPFDIEDRCTAHLALLSLVETVAARLRQAEYCAQLVSVSFRTNEFLGTSHQRKLFTATDNTNLIYKAVCELFDELWQDQPIRHLGVRVSELCTNDFVQLSLFDKANEKQRTLDRVVDSIRSKFGSNSVFRSSFLQSGLSSMTGGTAVDVEYPMFSSVL